VTRFNSEKDYVVEGIAMKELWRISCRLNDGMTMTPDERRDLAQAMQLLLVRTVVLT
jgi:hypothetical protein